MKLYADAMSCSLASHLALLAAGLPFVGSDSGEIPFVVRDSGLVVGEKDVTGWTRAIGELITSPERCREFAEKGLQRARDEFAWPAVARQYLDFFERVLAEKHN